jgi:hypothetical protein
VVSHYTSLRKPGARRAADAAARVWAEARGGALCPPLDPLQLLGPRALLCEVRPFLAQQAARSGSGGGGGCGGGGGWGGGGGGNGGGAAAEMLSPSQRSWLLAGSGATAFAGLAPGARLRSGFAAAGAGARRGGGAWLQPGAAVAGGGDDSDPEDEPELRAWPQPASAAAAAGGGGGWDGASARARPAGGPDPADPIDDFSD